MTNLIAEIAFCSISVARARGIVAGRAKEPSDADLAPNPIDLAIERCEDFTKAAAKEGGAPPVWRTFQSSINLTDGANPGSVDFSGIAFFQNFKAGYRARWVRCDTARRLLLNLRTSGVGSAIHLTAWVNGQHLYCDLIHKEPKRQAYREVELRVGWNLLVFKSCHRTWQWQRTIKPDAPYSVLPEELDYRASAL